LETLTNELDSLGATTTQRERFGTDPTRALAALEKARGKKNPLSYAMSVFNSDSFSSPKKADTNRSVVVNCRTCSGDRMVVYATRTDTYNGRSAEVEEYAPCPDCNATCNTSRVRYRSPDPARVRERLAS